MGVSKLVDVSNISNISNISELKLSHQLTVPDKTGSASFADSLQNGDKSAFIVNIPNNTIITMMTEREMKENIFTNIDSAVLF